MHRTMQWIGALGFDAFMVPFEKLRLSRVRSRLVLQACGRVLELGAGTGANLPYFDWGCIDELTLTDKNESRHVLSTRLSRAQRLARIHNGAEENPSIDIGSADAMRLPFDDESFDTVIATLLFCSVPEPAVGLNEVRRVLKPGGRYLFLEHVVPEHPVWRTAFNVVNPVWTSFSGGCNLNRDTLATMQSVGFRLEWMERDRNRVFVHGLARP